MSRANQLPALHYLLSGDSPLTMPAFCRMDDPFLTSSPGFSEAVDSSATGTSSRRTNFVMVAFYFNAQPAVAAEQCLLQIFCASQRTM